MMLAASVLPLMIFTANTVISQYQKTYERMIVGSNNSIALGEEHLTVFIEEMKNVFYDIELDSQFRKTIADSDFGRDSAKEFSTIRRTLLKQLDQKTNFSTIELYLYHNPTKVTISRSGSFQTEQEDARNIFIRPEGLQNNMFVKELEGKLYAVHYMNTFPAKKLLAKLAVKLKDSAFEEIISQLKTYETETVYLLNDEYETLLFSGEEKKDILERSIEQMKSSGFTGRTLELENYYVFFGQSLGRKINIINMIPKAEILNAVLPTVYIGLLTGVICVIFAVFFSALLSYYVSRPIVALTKKVKNISRETLEIPEKMNTGDEVGVLEDHITLFVEEIKELILKEYETKIEAKSAQIRALQAQINPHFLHNTLQLMGSISLSKDASNVYTIATALSDMMRYSMNFKEVFVTLEEELRNVNNYLLIQKTRYFDKFKIDIRVEEEAKDCLLPKMILQPLIENCFRHGFEHSTEEWLLQIRIRLEGEQIVILVQDNGEGMSREKMDEINRMLAVKEPQINNESHIGLMNVGSRIRLHFPEDGGVFLFSELGKGTEIKVTFLAKHQEVGMNDV